jgi:hypothetical protein
MVDIMTNLDLRDVLELFDAYKQLRKISPENIKRNAHQKYI